jgi:hypothetical protein
MPWHLTWGVVYEFLRVATHPNVFRKPFSLADAWGQVGRGGHVLAKLNRLASFCEPSHPSHAAMFPTLGKSFGKSSKAWKKNGRIFQALDKRHQRSTPNVQRPTPNAQRQMPNVQ